METVASQIPTKKKKVAIHRRLYNWVLHWADTPYSMPALAAISFVESSFFPIPPDVLLMPLCLGNRRKAFWFATVCTVASVVGGIAGYAIGWGLYESVAAPVLAALTA